MHLRVPNWRRFGYEVNLLGVRSRSSEQPLSAANPRRCSLQPTPLPVPDLILEPVAGSRRSLPPPPIPPPPKPRCWGGVRVRAPRAPKGQPKLKQFRTPAESNMDIYASIMLRQTVSFSRLPPPVRAEVLGVWLCVFGKGCWESRTKCACLGRGRLWRPTTSNAQRRRSPGVVRPSLGRARPRPPHPGSQARADKMSARARGPLKVCPQVSQPSGRKTRGLPPRPGMCALVTHHLLGYPQQAHYSPWPFPPVDVWWRPLALG